MGNAIRTHRWAGIAAFGGSLLFLAIHFGSAMLAPNRYVSESGGDGIKNTYAYQYYIAQDSGLHFSGMNYPYGEHILFPDAQALLAVPLNALQRAGYEVTEWSIGLSNALMLYSVGLAGLMLFLVLRHFQLPVWYSVISAIIIASLSPPIFRFISHQALGQAGFVPLVWWTMLQVTDRSRRVWAWGLLLMAWPLLFGAWHLYYLPLGSLFILAYAGVYALSSWGRWRLRLGRLAWLVGASLAPIVLTQLFIGATDPYAAGRIAEPWGFFYYQADLVTVFLPGYTFYYDWLSHLLPLPGYVKFEGYASIGLVGSTVIALTLWRNSRFSRRRQWGRWLRPTLTPSLDHSMWAAFLLFLFSTGFPFEWGLEWLLDYLPQLRQFRSLGRFSWAFYYVFSGYAAFYVYLLYRRAQLQSRTALAIGTVALAWGIGLSSAYSFQHHVRTYNPNAFAANAFVGQAPIRDSLLAAGYSPDEFQAFLGLPFFHSGSEKVGVKNSNLTFDQGFVHAYQLGLPMIDTYSPRSSIPHAMRVLQLLSDSLIDKTVLADLPNDKPLLMVVYEDETQFMRPYELYLQERGTLLATMGHVKLYRLPLSAFASHRAHLAARFEREAEMYEVQDSPKGRFYSRDTVTEIWYNSFDAYRSDSSYAGGSWLTNTGEEFVLLETELSSTQDLNMSFWIAVNTIEGFPRLYHTVHDSLGQHLYTNRIQLDKSLNYDRGWMRVDFDIPKHPAGAWQRFTLQNADHVHVDELLVAPKGSELYYRVADGRLFFNNYRLE